MVVVRSGLESPRLDVPTRGRPPRRIDDDLDGVRTFQEGHLRLADGVVHRRAVERKGATVPVVPTDIKRTKVAVVAFLLDGERDGVDARKYFLDIEVDPPRREVLAQPEPAHRGRGRGRTESDLAAQLRPAGDGLADLQQ
jgi:hypothetical protein